MLDPRRKPHVKVQPPFIRPDLSERQITIKVTDNGIHSTIISSKVTCLHLLGSFPLFLYRLWLDTVLFPLQRTH